MATDSAKQAVHRTLGAGVEDVITLTQLWDRVEVMNLGPGTIYASRFTDAITAESQDDTERIPSGSTITLRPHITGTAEVVVRLFSDDACEYAVTGRN